MNSKIETGAGKAFGSSHIDRFSYIGSPKKHSGYVSSTKRSRYDSINYSDVGLMPSFTEKRDGRKRNAS